MRAFVFFLILSFVVTAGAKSVTDTVSLKPLWYLYHSFHGINHLSFEAHDIYGSGVTVYLNAGEITNFDKDSSLIHCVDVKSCSVKNLPLSTGSYTLFIYNDHYITNQTVSYSYSYWSFYEEVILLVFFLILLSACCCCCCCLYRACCHQSSAKQVTLIYERQKGMKQMPVKDYALENRVEGNFAPYTEVSPSATSSLTSKKEVAVEMSFV